MHGNSSPFEFRSTTHSFHGHAQTLYADSFLKTNRNNSDCDAVPLIVAKYSISLRNIFLTTKITYRLKAGRAPNKKAPAGAFLE